MNQVEFSEWLDAYCERSTQSSFQKPLIMGIVNVTPDSFSDQGRYQSLDKALQRAMQLIEEGADILDIGGESSRPGAAPVPLDQELARVIPLIEQLRLHTDCCISIDTYKPEVMEAALGAGADIINDITALSNPLSLSVALKYQVPVCLMHMQGSPQMMQDNPSYAQGVVPSVLDFFEQRVQQLTQAGLARKNCILDPGFGYGKTVEHNLTLVKELETFQTFNLPLLLGVSRKSTIGEVLGKKVEERLTGSIAMAIYSALKGVGIIRAHDVDETSQALQMITAICQAG